MSEQEVRDGLRAAVSGEPPLAFDPDALMTKAQQKIRGRRALIAAGVATVGVAVAAVAVPTMLGTPRGSTAGQPPAGGPPVACDPSLPVPTPTSYEITFPPSPSPTPLDKLVPPKAGEVRFEELTPGTYRVFVSPTAPPSATPCPAPTSSAATSPPPAATSAPTNPDVPWPPPNVTPKSYTALELNKRGAKMQEHLRNQFGKVVAGATSVKPGVFQGEAAGDVEDGQGYLNAFTTFTMNGTRYAVDIYTSAPGAAGLTPSEACAESTATACVVDKRADGSAIVVGTLSANESGSLRVVTVTHFRPNGTVVRATGYNYDPTGSGTPTATPTMPVTVEQLTALATDPALGL